MFAHALFICLFILFVNKPLRTLHVILLVIQEGSHLKLRENCDKKYVKIVQCAGN